jgi:UDP-3-O-acyl-N-acetylglucosamine deacetylase
VALQHPKRRQQHNTRPSATPTTLNPTPDTLFRTPDSAPADDRRDHDDENGSGWSLPAELPRPAAYQQTLSRSFTLGGIGLHTGRFHTVRLRPASAGEGRYFVRVAAGSNAGRWDPELGAQGEAVAGALLIDAENPPELGAPDAAAAREEIKKRAAALRAVAGGADDPETERRRAELFREWRDCVENGGLVGGSEEEAEDFGAWVRAREREELERAKALGGGAAAAATTTTNANAPPLEDDAVVARPRASDPDASAVIEASIRNVYVLSAAPCVQLHASDPDEAAGAARVESVLAPERLLAALEACGVDNCRIEIEAAAEDEQEDNDNNNTDPLATVLEVPVMDGSALGWCLWVQSVGLRPAPVPEAALSDANLPRLADGTVVAPRGVLAPREPVTVRAPAGQDAHATLVPALFPRYTAGVDRSNQAPVIGTQWHSWAYARGEHFRYDLAPARMVASSRDELSALRRRGLLKGGGEGVVLVAHGSRWWDSAQVRFPLDEAARSDAVDLVGTLALLGVAGHGGLPAGHVVAFNADAPLRLALAREVLSVCARAAQEDAAKAGGAAPSSWEDLLVSYASVLAAQAGEVDAEAAAAAQRSVAEGLRDSKQL